ncbi:MAG: carboxypeptidase-like regulatory domain-containing protein, partial [Planctomycetota bacterium]
MRALLVALVLTLGLGAWWLLRAHGPDGQPDGLPSMQAADSPDEIEPDEPASLDPESINAATTDPDGTVAADPTRVAAPIALDPVPGRCVVHGRIVDANGSPIDGALVQLYAKRRWAKGSDAAPLEGGVPGAFAVDGHVGYEATSDAAGRFALETAVPSTRRVQLQVTRSAFHSIHTDRFTRGKDDALVEGVRDLGDVMLRAAGGVRGSVLDTEGGVLPDAELELAQGFDTVLTFSAGEDGRFEVGHVRPGRYRFTARAPGRATEGFAGFIVEGGRWNGPVDLRLAPGPEVAGRVVD